MYRMQRRYISNPNYEHALAVFADGLLRNNDYDRQLCGAVLHGGSDRFGSDVFDIVDPNAVPDQFVLGPVFVGLGSDTDCDGTTYHAVKIVADNLRDALIQADEYPHVYKVITLREADDDDIWEDGRKPGWDERAYFLQEGYASLGADWNPWVYDDSLGTVLDHTNDDPVIRDDDLVY
jgi:hypothetical protein